MKNNLIHSTVLALSSELSEQALQSTVEAEDRKSKENMGAKLFSAPQKAKFDGY